MIWNRAVFALVFASALLAFTAIWGNQGLSIDPDGNHATASEPADQSAGPLSDQGLSIDPDGGK